MHALYCRLHTTLSGVHVHVHILCLTDCNAVNECDVCRLQDEELAVPKKQGNVCVAAVIATTSQQGATKTDRKTAQQRRKERARDARST